MSDLVLMEQQQALDELMSRAHARFLDCSNLTLEEAERLGEVLALLQRDVMFQLGDLARYAEAKWPDHHHQVWPPWVSPGLLSRNAGVCRAFPKEADRQHECTYSQYLQVAGKPDRQKLLAEMVDKGQTTDESRKPALNVRGDSPATARVTEKVEAARWLLAVDVNYFLHRFWHSGAGVESAMSVASWVGRTVARLKEKGLTDVACCFDAPDNHRKALTKDWEDKYKDRPPHDPELIQQLTLVRDLLQKANFSCVSVEGMEGDDLLASYGKQFDGKVTLLTQDKDCRQCLSGKCNILLDVTWSEDDTSGEHMPDYKWVTAKDHTLGCTYSGTPVEGITPEKWTEFQTLAGDATDGIRGVEGVGAKGAADLIKALGTVDEVIKAAKDTAYKDITDKKRAAIIAFEPKLEVTRALVTLRSDLIVPNATRIG